MSRDDSRTARHLLHHGAGVQRIDVVPQDAPDFPRVLVLVGADAGLAHHVLAREYETWASDHRRLQHGVRLLVGGVKLRGLVAPARLQRLAQDVLLGYAREGDRILEDVHPKAGVEPLSSSAAPPGRGQRPGCCSTPASRRRFACHARGKYGGSRRTP